MMTCGLLGDGLLAQLVHVDAEVVLLHLVGGDVVELAGEVELHAVGQVAAVGQGQAQDLVAGGDHGGQRGGVGLRAGVRLDVGVLGAEQGLDAVDGQLLGDVDVLAAAVVAAARVALGVLVGQDGALGFHHGARGEVFGGDHFQGAALAAKFLVQDGGDFGIELGQRLVADGGGSADGIGEVVTKNSWLGMGAAKVRLPAADVAPPLDDRAGPVRLGAGHGAAGTRSGCSTACRQNMTLGPGVRSVVFVIAAPWWLATQRQLRRFKRTPRPWPVPWP